MLQAFIDDSGSVERPDKRLVLAGYIQTAEAWDSFSKEWAAVLAADPPLKALHMTGFHGFSKEAKDTKIDALVAVLSRYRPISVECSISTRDYKELLSSTGPYDLRHPYCVCFIGMLHAVARAIDEEGLKGPVELIFDQQGNVGTNAAIWYPPLKQSNPLLAKTLGGPPLFRSDEEVLPLQAADMLAWHVRKVSEPAFEARHLVVADAIRFRHRHMEIPRNAIESWAQAFQRMPGIDAVRGRSGSVNRDVARLIESVPPEELIPVFESMARRGRRLRILKRVLEMLGLRWVWKKIAKAKLRVR